jgi:hypothetical protein
MTKKLTYEEVKSYIEIECQNWYNFKLIDKEYINNHIPLHIKDIDGYQYYISLNNIKKYHKSNSKLLRFTSKNKFYIENIKLWLMYNRKGYKLISTKMEKINNQYKLLFECDKGHKFYMKFNNMIYLNQHCPVCMGNKKYTIEEVRQIFEEKGYILISKKYRNARSKLKYICSKHKNLGIQEATLMSVINSKYICNECLSEYKRNLYVKTQKEFENEVYKLVGDEYTVLGKYINTHTKIQILHNECNNSWNIEPNAFLSGVRCPFCSVSSEENRIKEFLNKFNINYEMQVKFDECKNIRPLPFDFGINDRNQNLLFLIEYDGEGHFEPYRYGNKKDMLQKLRQQQQNDNIKNQYCKDNNISLLRIPYWEFNNIEKILKEWLVKYGLIHNKNMKNVIDKYKINEVA